MTVLVGKRTANFNMLPEVDDVADPNENVGVVHENNAIDEADATVEAGTIRRRVLRSSTGEEACVTFMLGDHKLERHSNKQQSPEPNWMCFLKRQPQKNISIDKDTVEAVVEAE